MQNTKRNWAHDNIPGVFLRKCVERSQVTNVHSESLVRFQAYSAVAYGAKGIMWYCWGRALWNFTANGGNGGKTDIYPAVQEVNGRLTQQWANAVIEFNLWQGVFSTGWAVPDGTRLFTHEDDSPSCTPTLSEFESRSRAPGPGMIVEAMDTDLLIGVMTSSKMVSDEQPGMKTGGSGEVLLVVVDKRVDTGLAAPAARSVKVHFNRKLVTQATILPLGASASQVNVSFDEEQRTLTITGITGGDAVALIVCGECEAAADEELQEAAKGLHKLRYDARRPDLSATWTTQYQYYQADFVSKRQTTFILGLMDLGLMCSPDHFGCTRLKKEYFQEVASSGFNLVSVKETHLGTALNFGLREGVAVLTDNVTVPGTADVARIQKDFGCHPNFAGFAWAGTPVASDDRALPALHKRVERYSPHAFAIVRSSSAEEVLKTSNATGLPMVALAQPKGSAAEMMSGIAKLGNALAELPGAETSFLVAVDVCTLSYGQARLQAYAGLMFGASGVLFTNATTGFIACAKTVQGPPRLDQSETIKERLRFAAPINDALAQWQAKLRQSGSPGSPKVKIAQLVTGTEMGIPGVEVVLPGIDTPSFKSLVLNMSDQLVVGVYQPLGTDGKINATKSPPLLYVLDTREGGSVYGDIRTANLTLNASVSAWTPFVGSAEKGFPNCVKSVLGNQPLLPLLPGQAVLIGLTMAPPVAAPVAGMQERWATAGRHRRAKRP